MSLRFRSGWTIRTSGRQLLVAGIKFKWPRWKVRNTNWTEISKTRWPGGEIRWPRADSPQIIPSGKCWICHWWMNGWILLPVSGIPLPVSGIPYLSHIFPYLCQRFPYLCQRFTYLCQGFPYLCQGFPYLCQGSPTCLIYSPTCVRDPPTCVKWFPYLCQEIPLPVSEIPLPVSEIPLPVSGIPRSFSICSASVLRSGPPPAGAAPVAAAASCRKSNKQNIIFIYVFQLRRLNDNSHHTERKRIFWWVQREFNLMFTTMSSDKDQRKNWLSRSFSVNKPSRPIHTERKFSLMFAVYSLIFVACSLIFSLSLLLSFGVNRPLNGFLSHLALGFACTSTNNNL